MKDYKGDSVWLMHGDCLERMKDLDDNSVDSIVTDPPYGLGFMGKHWDKGVPSAEIWAEALRVLKPGGHLLAFAGTRTQHRMAVNIEDAGFEIRDMIAWVYGSGFPKSNNVSKAIDKAAGAEREVSGAAIYADGRPKNNSGKAKSGYSGGLTAEGAGIRMKTAPATEAAKQWDGWGTALKPALEPITVARKPFKGTVAANVLAHGTGALNIDGCRVATGDDLNGGGYSGGTSKTMFQGLGRLQPDEFVQPSGRWPANLIHDGSDEVLGLFPVTTSGGGPKPGTPRTKANTYGEPTVSGSAAYGSNTGSAARFFYCAKASKKDRDEGLGAFATATAGGGRNIHPTVKPTDLMRHLCRLVTPPNGVVLDPFLGSGSTGKAARLEGFRFIGIELDSQYFDIAKQRICLIH